MGGNSSLFDAARGAAGLARFKMENPGSGFCWEPNWCITDEEDDLVQEGNSEL
jgi:hypothetical protein